jgi:hypothetical protein
MKVTFLLMSQGANTTTTSFYIHKHNFSNKIVRKYELVACEEAIRLALTLPSHVLIKSRRALALERDHI